MCVHGNHGLQYTATARSKRAAEHAAAMEALAALAAAGQLGRPLALEVTRMQSRQHAVSLTYRSCAVYISGPIVRYALRVNTYMDAASVPATSHCCRPGGGDAGAGAGPGRRGIGQGGRGG